MEPYVFCVVIGERKCDGVTTHGKHQHELRDQETELTKNRGIYL